MTGPEVLSDNDRLRLDFPGICLYQIAALSGKYLVIAKPRVTEDDASAAVRLLEEQGRIPFRSVARGRAQLAIGGSVEEGQDGDIVIRGEPFEPVIFGSTIALMPRGWHFPTPAERALARAGSKE